MSIKVRTSCSESLQFVWAAASFAPTCYSSDPFSRKNRFNKKLDLFFLLLQAAWIALFQRTKRV